MRPIIVPLDGSGVAESSLHLLTQLELRDSSKRVVLARALETPILTAWLPAEVFPLREKERELAEAYLADWERELEKKGFEVDTHIAEPPLHAAISELQESHGSQLTVLSSRGHSGWSRVLLGSKAQEILSNCSGSLLMVKVDPSTSIKKFQNILVPLDGSKRAEASLPQVLEIAPGGKARITLLGVSEVVQGHAFEGDLRALVKPDLKRITEYLESQATWLSNQGYQVDCVVRRGHPAREVLELATKEEIDLIVVSNRGHGNHFNWPFGSVAERILWKSPCSVLILKLGEVLVVS